MSDQDSFVGLFDSLPQCLSYHPVSELSKQPGYYPNINAAQLVAASQVIKVIGEEKLNFVTDREDTFLKVLRFLRARKYNVKNALHMIREDVKWRSEQRRLNLSQETAQEVLNCEVKLLYQYFPVWFQGFDKQMRPVSYRQFGKFEIWNVLKLTTMERLIRFHAWETEQALRSMYEISERTGYNIETFVLVIDAAGWNMKLATSDAFTFIKGMAVTDSDHYPERLGTMVIINAPTVLSFAWRIIQGFLDSVTKDKIRILSDPEDWQPVLQQCIDRDQIPMQYGGTARNLSADEAISAMNPPAAAPGSSVVVLPHEKDNYGVLSDLHGAAEAAAPASPPPRLMTEGHNRTPFTPRISHMFASSTPMSALTQSTLGGQDTPAAATAAAAAHCGRRNITTPAVVSVDRSTQTDEGDLVMQQEITKARAQCQIM